MDYIIQNGIIVNEGSMETRNLFIHDGRLVDDENKLRKPQTLDATGCYILPGIIDTHVHFRDPGFPEKADFATESRAALAGGVTSVIDMPNTNPQTTTLELLEEKEAIAAQKSAVNYAFMVGATNDNIDQLLSIPTDRYAAIKLFLGSSTGRASFGTCARKAALCQSLSLGLWQDQSARHLSLANGILGDANQLPCTK